MVITTNPPTPPHTKSFLTNKAKRSLNFKKLTKRNVLGKIKVEKATVSFRSQYKIC